MTYIIDTNILLDYPQIIEDMKNKENIVISTDVLKELDGLKRNNNSDTAFKARRAAVTISHNIKDIIWNDTYENESIPTDDKLLLLTQDYKGCLITNDVYLKVKAIIKDISTEGYGNKKEYTGVKNIIVETDDNRYSDTLDFIFANQTYPDEEITFTENEYLIIRDKNVTFINKNKEVEHEVLATFVYKEGKLLPVYDESIKNKWINYIKPRNPEQVCLFNALNNRNNTIIYAGGGFGLGKTFLLNNFALQELEKERIKKIIYVPNNATVQNSMEFGFQPGDMFSKVLPMIGPLVDLVGIDGITRMIQDEQLEIIPIGFMRGRNFEDSIILVSEAQNLDEEQVKLLIGRVGEGSRILFEGSMAQVDSNVFREKSGLKLLLSIAKHPEYSKKFATVKLKNVERSETAQIADYLDRESGNI